MTLLDWARQAVVDMGTQKAAAEQTGISYATLQRILAGASPLTVERLSKIASASSESSKAKLAEYLRNHGGLAGAIDADLWALGQSGVSPVLRDILDVAEQGSSSGRGVGDSSSRYVPEPAREISGPVSIPALTTKASAGDGSLLWGSELGDGPFRFMEDWLRREFGSIASLRLIQIRGDSQLPDLSDGDWAIIDTAKDKMENGLSVIRLDDCLMIKRLQREGHFLQLISRNPIYAPTAIDLSKEEYRVQVVGKVVFVFKAV